MILVASAWSASLSGTITGPDGAPEPNATVWVYDQRFEAYSATSNDEGRWSIGDLPYGRWRTRVLPDIVTTGAETWAGGTVGYCSGVATVLGADDEATVDVQLAEGATLSGTVETTSGDAAEGVVVEVQPVWARELGVQGRVALTDAAGDFVVTGIPASTDERDQVRVQLRGAVPRQYHPSVWSEIEASLVDVPPATDALLATTTVFPGTDVSGTIRVGQAVATEGRVYLYDGLQTHGAEIRDDGSYTFWGMRAVPLLVWTDVPGTARTYWTDSETAGELLAVPEPGVPITDVDITVRLGGRIEGRLVGAEVWEDASVLPVRLDGSGGPRADVEPDGTFVVTELPAGNWLLEVAVDQDDLLSGLLDGTPVTVEPGATVTLGELEVSRGALVQGTVVDPYTDELVYGATVAVVDPVTGGRVTTRSDRDGVYVLGPVTPGIWSLEADYGIPCDGDPDYVSLRWPATANPDLRGTVELVVDEPFLWDVPMPADADDDQMADGWELENGLDPSVDDRNDDPDGDGFSNLREFWLGTDPQQVYEAPGCSCRTGASPSGSLLGLLLFGGWRRRRATLTTACSSSSSR